jgi:hypothetical protein
LDLSIVFILAGVFIFSMPISKNLWRLTQQLSSDPIDCGTIDCFIPDSEKCEKAKVK